MLIALGVVTIAGLPALNADPGSTDAAESRWQKLKNRLPPPSARLDSPNPGGPKTPAERQQKRGELIAHFRALAADAGVFRDQNASHAKAPEAKALEAKSLLKAMLMGDKASEAQAMELAAAVEKDRAVSSRERFEVASLAELALVRTFQGSRQDRLAAQKLSAAYLVSEFPNEAGGHLSLLGAVELGGSRSDLKLVAREIIESEHAPFVAKARAQILLERYELVGKSLADVANTALGRGNFFEQCRGRQVLLYTWAAWSRSSIQFAKEIVSAAPAGVLVIGFNLDRDLAAAREIAGKESLPGEQYYNEGGIGSWVALLLKLDSAPLVYLTDDNGVIRDVAGQRNDLAAGLAAARQR